MDKEKCIEINCEYYIKRHLYCKRRRERIIYIVNPCFLYRSVSSKYESTYVLPKSGYLMKSNQYHKLCQ